MLLRVAARVRLVVAAVVVMAVLSGCSLLFGGRPDPAPTPAVERRLVPTFTPTPEQPVAAQAPADQPAPVEQATPVVVVEQPAPPAAPEPVETPTEAPPTPTPSPKLTVNLPTANTRLGPGTNYGLAGTVSQGQTFDVIGKSPDGTWWQICCVNGQQVWIFGELVVTENVGGVAVAQNIPAPPPVVVAPTATPAPPPPAAPEPAAPPPPPAGAVHAGPCGGDDGCKFKIRRGPSKANNGGGELKMQLFFIHSGVDGGQPQGDYRLGIEKDGQLLTVFADTRSIVFARNQGPLGPFNYEAKMNASSLPGGTVAGTYFFWVLDGNRERDSEVFRLDLGEGEGEVWIEFDQG